MTSTTPDHVLMVTVTYGSRHELCIETCRRALAHGVSHVLVIDNGSAEDSSAAIRSWLVKSGRGDIVHLSRNTGSAGGFHCGLQAALQFDFPLIWLLDDDNFVAKDTLPSLLQQRSQMIEAGVSSLCAFASVRIDFHNGNRNDGAGLARNRVYPPAGSFLHFDVWQKLCIRLAALSTPANRTIEECQAVPYAPYGGLLLSKGLIEIIGLPNQALVLYEDDTEYTARMSRVQLGPYRCWNSRVYDAEGKWVESGQPRLGPRRLLESTDSRRLYFTIRNRILFDRSRCLRPLDWLRYQFNRLIYYAVLKAMRPSRTHGGKTYRLIKRADRDARSNTLGPAPSEV